MSSTKRNIKTASFALCVVLVVACEETTDPTGPTGPTGFDDNEDLGNCTLTFTNETGYLIDQGQFFPTDSFGILKEFPDLPIEPGDTRTMVLMIGVYQMKVNNSENHYFFTSFDHTCIKDQILEVAATIEDLKVGMLKVNNHSWFPVTSVLLASTDDLTFGSNQLEGLLENGDKTAISSGPGRFYWLIEDSEGNTYFGSTHVYGSVDGGSSASDLAKIDSGELCTLTLTNGAGVTIDYIHTSTPWQDEIAAQIMDQNEEAIGVKMPNNEVFDSQGNLLSSESLNILISPGTSSLIASSQDSGDWFEITGLVCSDGLPLTATLGPEDVQ
ncbi:MAG: hypothetical protein QNJ97_24895 [Myxococcota bacterium]|nr:hypothetical protein [Myxococcota bacterium]